MGTDAGVGRGGLGGRPEGTVTPTRWAARAGLLAWGFIYLVVGLLALRIAFSDRGRQADRSGALAELADRPYGSVLLWALGIGLVGMAVWRLSEALFGATEPDGHSVRKRLLSAARCVFYAVLAWSVLAFAAGAGGGGRSSDAQSRDVTARLMQLPAGQWLVGAAGAGIVVTGVWLGAQALRRAYRKELKLGEMSPRARKLVDVAGVGGGLARALLFVAAGAFAIRAAVDFRPDRAKGMDDTLRSFAATSAGPGLLVAVAAGLMLFGLFAFALARWRRV
ncbi:DUF1206 domain-containing protein [Streptomyces sp. NPDC007905]|uniref:DUF1206 domain-containing protein n=1 Tax=Streptomyces sp. NPDC007905 TaxID=3364788 RepID=UPI0036E38FCD